MKYSYLRMMYTYSHLTMDYKYLYTIYRNIMCVENAQCILIYYNIMLYHAQMNRVTYIQYHKNDSLCRQLYMH